MVKIPFTDLKIRVWMPMEAGQPYLALIDQCPLIFKGPSPFAVHKAADEWRKAEVAKIERAEENARNRADAARAAREAKREAAE